jgi:tetratricopeptide (TPR) repeat protein
LTQRIKSTALALVLLACVAGYAWASTRIFLASRAVTENTIAGLERSVRLDPWNAEYSLLLARSRALGQLDFAGGIREYQRALALNPHSSRGWLDLAAAYQVAGDTSNQTLAIERAIAVDPTTPSVAWEAATFYVLQGKIDKALPHYRTVLSSQGGETTSILEVLWPITEHDADRILTQALPPDERVYGDFLRFAVAQKDLPAARKVWSRWVALKLPVTERDAFPFIQFLFDSHEPAAALSAWTELAELQPKFKTYLPTAENLVVNGDFEDELLGGGLEWSFAKQNAVDLKVDSLEFHSGNRSLSATFDAGSVASLGFSQRVPVQRGSQYRFSAFVKAEGLTTASGPRLSISDGETGERIFLSEDRRGSTGWQEINTVFRVPPSTAVVRIEVVRDPAYPLIKGKFYMDDFAMRRVD